MARSDVISGIDVICDYLVGKDDEPGVLRYLRMSPMRRGGSHPIVDSLEKRFRDAESQIRKSFGDLIERYGEFEVIIRVPTSRPEDSQLFLDEAVHCLPVAQDLSACLHKEPDALAGVGECTYEEYSSGITSVLPSMSGFYRVLVVDDSVNEGWSIRRIVELLVEAGLPRSAVVVALVGVEINKCNRRGGDIERFKGEVRDG